MAEQQWENVTTGVASPEEQVWETVTTGSNEQDFSLPQYLLQRFTNPLATAGAGAAQPGSLTGFLPLSGQALETQAAMPPVSAADLQQGMGLRVQQAPDAITQIMGGGVEAIGDPLTYMFPGLTVPSKLGVGLSTGTAAEFGGIIGEQVAGTPGQIVGALTTGTIAGAKTPAIGIAAKAGVSGIKQTWDKFQKVRVDPEAVEDAFASTGVKSFLEKAVANQGGADNFDALMESFNAASQFVRGADTPLLIAMAENPTVRASVVSLLRKDKTGDVRAQFNKELEAVGANIKAKADLIFGARYKPFDEGTQGMHPSIIKQMAYNERQRLNLP